MDSVGWLAIDLGLGIGSSRELFSDESLKVQQVLKFVKSTPLA